MTKPTKRRQHNSTLPARSAPLRSSGSSSSQGARKARKARTPLAKVGKQKAKRQARNAEYYRSAEWRAKRKAVFERDGFQCTETYEAQPVHTSKNIAAFVLTELFPPRVRCPNRGEIVNGKQTARGLVCEEKSYRHRGVEGYIDTCTTRCKDCDRRLTPLERVNHRYGFQSHGSASRTETV